MRRHQRLVDWLGEGKPHAACEGPALLADAAGVLPPPAGLHKQAMPCAAICQRYRSPDIVCGFPAGHPAASCILGLTLESGGTFLVLYKFHYLSYPDLGRLALYQPLSSFAPLANVTPI